MEQTEHTYHVQFLGGFSISYEGQPIFFDAGLQSKTVQILLMLLKAGEAGIEKKELITLVRPNEIDKKRRLHNFRQQVYLLKKFIASHDFPKGEYIVVEGDRYYFSKRYRVETDTGKLDALIGQIKKAPPGSEELYQLDLQYCQSYTGGFLPMLEGEEWVSAESAAYQKWYSTCLSRLCQQLKEKGQYETMLELSTTASQIHPYDEWQAVQLDCLMAMDRYKEALRIYEEATESFYKDMGVTLLDKVMARYQNKDRKLYYGADILAGIRRGLTDEEGRDCAYQCSYPSFQDAYRVVARMGERMKVKSLLLLCTLTVAPGKAQGAKTVAEKMEVLRQVLLASLRSTDAYTRYSKGQYLVLLIRADEADGKVILDRLERNWKMMDRDRDVKVRFTIEPVGCPGIERCRDEQEGHIYGAYRQL